MIEKLVFQFDLADALHVQQILMALEHGYKLSKTFSSHGCAEFHLIKEVK